MINFDLPGRETSVWMNSYSLADMMNFYSDIWMNKFIHSGRHGWFCHWPYSDQFLSLWYSNDQVWCYCTSLVEFAKVTMLAYIDLDIHQLAKWPWQSSCCFYYMWLILPLPSWAFFWESALSAYIHRTSIFQLCIIIVKIFEIVLKIMTYMALSFLICFPDVNSSKHWTSWICQIVE